jgi:nucleoside-diphosphate-sugar epimerase
MNIIELQKQINNIINEVGKEFINSEDACNINGIYFHHRFLRSLRTNTTRREIIQLYKSGHTFTKIKKILGWQPKISFEDGVKEVLKNIDYWSKAPVWTEKSIKDATEDWFKYLS